MSGLALWVYSALTLAACAAPKPPPHLAAPAHTGGSLRGETACRAGDPDCNVCAPHVLDQLDRALGPSRLRHKHAWQATSDTYPPSGRTLHDATLRYWAVPRTHVQGFVRTGSARYPFALSYSHREAGSLMLLSRTRDGSSLELARILKVPQHHPSGLAALGRFVVAANKDALQVVDLEADDPLHYTKQRVKRRDPKKRGIRGAGGGLALAKLGKARYLLLVATPGGESDRPRTTRFYELRGELPQLRRARYLGEVVYENPPAWEPAFGWSENVSLVTECGTGALYAVYTTGDARLGGSGYARVSRVEGTPNKPQLRHVAAYPMKQASGGCHLRSSATVFVERHTGELRFLCHQRAARAWELELSFEIHTAP